MKCGKFTFGIVLVGVMSVAGVRAEAAEKIQYRLKLKKGQKLYFRMITDKKITQTVLGQEQATEQTIGQGVRLDVNDVDKKGNAWIDYTYDWASLKQKGLMGEAIYDSNKEGARVPPAARVYAALLGEGFSVRITPEGRVQQFKGLKKMRENVEKKLPGGPVRQQMAKGLEQVIGEQAIRESIEGLLAIYPDKPVGVGDSWSSKSLLSREFPLVAEHKWTLKERSNGVAVLENKTTFKPNLEAKRAQAGYIGMDHILSGKQEGIIRIKESTGQLIDGKLNQELSGRMEMEMGVKDNKPQVFTIPMKIRRTIVIKVAEPTEKK
ncbi:MAG: DUF6263 family protein [Planctomycetota bacterium]